MKNMKKIVLSVIAAIVVSVGTYQVAHLLGAPDQVAVAFAAVTVAAVAFAVVAAFAVADEEGVPYWKAFVVYAVEALTIWGALAVGNLGWSAAIVLAGIGALYGLWRLYQHRTPELTASV